MMAGAVVDLAEVRDLLVPQRGDVDERGVSRLARDWWAAYEARRAAELEAESAIAGASGVLIEAKSARRIAGSRRGTPASPVRGRRKAEMA